MPDAIVVEGLHKRYRGQWAVRGVCFAVARGEIFGIVGPNGAGKTTTIEIMEGLRARDGGRVEVLGLDPAREPRRLHERIGVQFQTTAIQRNMKVEEALRLFSAFYKRRADRARLVEAFGLGPHLRKRFQDLSGGLQQRVSLALAVLHDPELVFLDEPSTGLDPAARRELWDVIRGMRDQGRTVVLTTHYMEEAERLCDRVAMFREGEVALLDQPKRLVARMAAADYLSFEAAGARVDALRAIAAAERVEAGEDGRIRVYAGQLQEAAYQVLRLARESGWTIRDFRFETGTLDDLFVALSRSASEPRAQEAVK